MKKIAILSACIALLLFSACNTQKRQIKKATAVFLANPNELAKLCAEQFPVKQVRQGKPDTVYGKPDTVYEKKIDSVPCPAAQPGKTVFVKCPPAKTINQKVYIHDTTYVKDTAEIDTLKNHNKEVNEKLTKSEGTAENQSKWLYRLGAYALLATGFIVWRFLKK